MRVLTGNACDVDIGRYQALRGHAIYSYIALHQEADRKDCQGFADNARHAEKYPNGSAPTACSEFWATFSTSVRVLC